MPDSSQSALLADFRGYDRYLFPPFLEICDIGILSASSSFPTRWQRTVSNCAFVLAEPLGQWPWVSLTLNLPRTAGRSETLKAEQEYQPSEEMIIKERWKERICWYLHYHVTWAQKQEVFCEMKLQVWSTQGGESTAGSRQDDHKDWNRIFFCSITDVSHHNKRSRCHHKLQQNSRSSSNRTNSGWGATKQHFTPLPVVF